MKFDFGKATDITEFAKNNFSDMYECYEKIYITPDTNDYHILRILKGFGEDYEEDLDSFILEHNMIRKPKGDTITGITKLRKILSEDDGGNWAYKVYSSIDDCIENVDGGFGIN